MDFITAPLVCGIVFYFTYMVFELFARRKERTMLIERMGQNIDPAILNDKIKSLLPNFPKRSFSGLRVGCLFIGIGFGLICGLLICIWMQGMSFELGRLWEKESIAYGASVLLFGGLGLIISYIIESKTRKKEEQ